MNIHDMLDLLIEQNGSDIHIIVGTPPMLRIHGELIPIEGAPVLNLEQAESLIFPIMTQEQKDYVKVNKELDFGYQFKDKGRFRINAYHAQGNLAAALRLIPAVIKTIDELQLPPILHEFSSINQGLVLLTGPTGEGKSTSLAAMIEEINVQSSKHIITIEDPVEFVYKPKKSIISQREINHDTHSWDIALKSALREDPDVVLIGEMRDYETIASAITIAETGHLVFATLHTLSTAQTIDRIIDVFPAHQQGQMRQQLASAIKAIVAQRLLPANGGGRIPALEILVATSAISNLIREQKTHQIDSVIQTSADKGMIMFESYLQQLVQRGAITKEVAMNNAFRPDDMARLLGK
ncbi:MAG: type IV pili twitching motility protein PilT [Candidatus Pacebacteria bacterium CG_4_10_14_3_um_filter_34_15]|nr:type IV pilus twitching motility protein PilT [Candidatus Pacearchaeota archaeon]NCQ66104.1 type IV pilus twitching motility protein PilT [Candidatus Paceibacterota bacterium]OIO43983.1 MAG: type IV pili twitching motility protein PilT [Candidatus Pacebacteria bacterium CG1_02_43_31]PIQ81204.1 MAG: type IV pili twitching motility protein PilT [Candidatus Pacebacteria bacterium CG11_big_fil_rev_8_21_14_0_20_34_55]PIX81180.1 MAG: type IV pili twitching motility protein PilT [Candidatus Pacebac